MLFEWLDFWPSRALKAIGWQSSGRGLTRIRLIDTSGDEFVADLLETALAANIELLEQRYRTRSGNDGMLKASGRKHGNVSLSQ